MGLNGYKCIIWEACREVSQLIPSGFRWHGLQCLCLGRVAQLVRAPPLQGGGRKFESCPAH